MSSLHPHFLPLFILDLSFSLPLHPRLPPLPTCTHCHLIQLLALKRATIDLRQTLQEMASVFLNQCPASWFMCHFILFSLCTLHPSPISSLPPFQDPTSPEAVDLHSRLAQYRREVKMVRQQNKNEEASDYNLLRTVLR